MEGVLLKWTNYFSGWQQRWFILDNGVLSYYKSQEDIINGCKGSIKMAVCDIAVHPTDATRLDLTIPGEQYYYVKASTPQDRQSWLIALGSSKAAFSETSVAKKSADVMPDLIRTKQSELRLYCDLLMQQVHSVKQLASKSDGVVEPEKLTESASLIAATCDMFIVTLDDCMKLISNVPVFESTHHLVRNTGVSVSPSLPSIQRLQSTRPVVAEPVEKPARHKPLTVSFTDSIRIHSLSSHHTLNGGSSPKQLDSPTIHHPVTSHSSPRREHVQSYSAPPLSPHQLAPPLVYPALSSSAPLDGVYYPLANVVNGTTPHMFESNGSLLNGTQEQISPFVLSSTTSPDIDTLAQDTVHEDISTFFSTMPTSFADVDTSQEDSILVIPFLDACKNLVPIFDKLSSTALSPVKMDFCGNIRKIEYKYGIRPEQFPTLQSMVLNEVEHNQHTHSDSATSALLWLKRSLEFIGEFLKECCSGCMDISVCAGNAYSRTLKHYHGWVVRGIFAVAVRALPYRETFISHLSVGETTEINTSSQHFEQALLSHIKTFELHLSRVLLAINDFYTKHSLDSSETV